MTVDFLIIQARLAAECTWDVATATVPQEPEVRKILRECANQLEAYRDRDRQLAELIGEIRKVQNGESRCHVCSEIRKHLWHECRLQYGGTGSGRHV